MLKLYTWDENHKDYKSREVEDNDEILNQRFQALHNQ